MSMKSLLAGGTPASVAPSEGSGLRGRMLASLGRVNWAAVVATLVLEGFFVAALISLGVISVTKVRQQNAVLELLPNQAASSAPAPPAPEKAEEKPVETPKPRTEIVVPPPEVEMPHASSPVAVAPPAPPMPVADAAPKAAPAAPSAGSGPVAVANLNTNLLNGSAPSYPMSSRRKREQGMVVLRLVISADGRVTDISVSRSSGFDALDEAAVAAVRKWRWSPTVRDGRPVPITGLVQIPFVLKET